MPTQFQLRRGNTSQNDSFTGASGELTVDTTRNTIRVHDGSTAGGEELLSNTFFQAAYANTNSRIANFTATGTHAANFVPDANVTYDLGTSSQRWRDLYLAGNTITLGEATISANASSGGIILPSGSTVSGTGDLTLLINDRIQIANATSTFATWSALTSTNTDIRTLVNNNLANTNAEIDLLNTNLMSTNTDIRALVNNNLANTNAEIDLLNTNLTSTNTSIRSLISGVQSELYSTNTAIRAYVDSEVAGLVDSAPETLNTLNELAAALGDDANFATTLTTNLGQKLGANASITLTGDISGSGTFSANAVSISVTVADDSHNHVISNIDGLSAFLANTNAEVDLLNTNLTSTNTDIRTLVNNNLANTNAYIATKVNTTTFNSALANTNAEIDLLNTNLTSTNTDIRTLVNNNLANTNAEIDLLNTNLTSTNTDIRALVSDRLQVANADVRFLRKDGSSSQTVGGQVTFTNGIVASGLTYPTSDGTSGQFISTDGAGNLTFADGGSGSDLAVTQIKYLNNPNFSTKYSAFDYDRFGTRVAVHGKYGMALAQGESRSENETFTGFVYIFDVETGELIYAIDPPSTYGDNSASEGDAIRLALNDKYFAIARSSEDDPSTGNDTGAVYLYDLETGNLQNTIVNPNYNDGSVNDDFGSALAFTNTHLITSATDEDDASGNSVGVVFVYDLDKLTSNSAATLVANADYYITNPNPNLPASDKFGSNLAADGNYIVVGAFSTESGNENFSGQAYIYDISGFASNTISSADYTLENPNERYNASDDYFGRSIAIHGNYVIVGAEGESGQFSGDDRGRAYIYDISGFASNTISSADYSLAPSDSDELNFGVTVGIHGNIAVVGSRYNYGVNASTRVGRISVFDINAFGSNTITTPDLIVNHPNPDNLQRSGWTFGSWGSKTLAFDGNIIVAGSPIEPYNGVINQGKVYIIELNTPKANTVNSGVLSPIPYKASDISLWNNSPPFSLVDAVESMKTDLNNSVSVTISQEYTIYNPNLYNTASSDVFGSITGVSGRYGFSIARGEDDAGGSSAGAAYIFDMESGMVLHKIPNPNYQGSGTGNEGQNGMSGAISGGYFAWGIGFETVDGTAQAGVVHIYSVVTGERLYTIENPSANSSGDRFGASVGISGNHVVVGVPLEDDATYGNNHGRAYVFDIKKFSSNVISSADYELLNPSTNQDYFEMFGNSVDIDNKWIVVGAPQFGTPSVNTGRAYVYDMSEFSSNTISSPTYTLPNPSQASSDNFGEYVAVGGNHAVISNPESTSGEVYLYNLEAIVSNNDVGTGHYWLNNPSVYGNSGSDAFGDTNSGLQNGGVKSISVSGNYVIVGAHQEDDANGFSVGAAYVYDINNLTTSGNNYNGGVRGVFDIVNESNFTLLNPNSVDTTSNDQFGYSVAISGDNIAVGARNEYDESGNLGFSGVVYTYKLNNADKYVYSGEETSAFSTDYYAGTPSDWNVSAPKTINQAIDRLAALVKTLNSGTGA